MNFDRVEDALDKAKVPKIAKKQAMQQMEAHRIVRVDHNDVYWRDQKTGYLVEYNYNNKTYHNHDNDKWEIPKIKPLM